MRCEGVQELYKTVRDRTWERGSVFMGKKNFSNVRWVGKIRFKELGFDLRGVEMVLAGSRP